MHGELPKPVEAPTTRRGRRAVVTGTVLVAGRRRRSPTSSTRPAQQQPQRRGRFAAERPGAGAGRRRPRRADVPVYLDAVGTIKALNTVTVRPQVDGKLLSVNFKEGQDVKKGDVLARIDPTTYQAQLDQADRQEGAGRSAARQRQDRSRRATRSSPPPTPSTSSRPTPSARWSRKTPRRCSPTRPRSTTRGRRWLHHHHRAARPAAPASAWSTKATSCTPPTPTGDRRDHADASRSRCMFNLPQQDLARVNDAFAKGAAARSTR